MPQLSIKINNCYMGLWKTSSVTFEPQRTLFLPLTRPEIKKWVSYENKTFSRKFSSFPSSLWLMYTRSTFSESICLLQTVVYNFENWEIFLSDCFIWFFVFNLWLTSAILPQVLKQWSNSYQNIYSLQHGYLKYSIL